VVVGHNIKRRNNNGLSVRAASHSKKSLARSVAGAIISAVSGAL
jgi:hypothetical protein